MEYLNLMVIYVKPYLNLEWNVSIIKKQNYVKKV